MSGRGTEAAQARATGVVSKRNRPGDLFPLTKPRITLVALISEGAGYLLGSGGEVDAAA